MKSATIPSLRVEPELRHAAEEILEEGESLSSFVEQSVREGIIRRRLKAEFLTRGLQSRDRAQASGSYIAADKVLDRLESMLADAKAARRQ